MKRFVFLATLLAFSWSLPLHSAPPPADAGRSVTLCAYNLKNYLKMEQVEDGKRVLGPGKPESEIATVVRFVKEIKPDILGVCEIGTEVELKDLQQRLKAEGVDLPNTELVHGTDPTRRLALLTRFPIVARHPQTDLPYRIGDQIFGVQRGFLDVTVQIHEDFELRCVGVHLKSKREVPEVDQSLMRRNEAHLLRRHTEAILIAKPETRLLVYGDFNEHRHEAPIAEIEGLAGTDVSLMDVRLRDVHGQTWTHYWDMADVYSRLDFCFVSRALQSQIDRKESHIFFSPDFAEASDHRPLVIKIKVPRKRD